MRHQVNLTEKIEEAFAARPKPAQVILADEVLQLDSDVEETLWFGGRDWHELNGRTGRSTVVPFSFSPQMHSPTTFRAY
jgi:hypothetical protein